MIRASFSLSAELVEDSLWWVPEGFLSFPFSSFLAEVAALRSWSGREGSDDLSILQDKAIAAKRRILRCGQERAVEGFPERLYTATSLVCCRAADRKIYQAVLTPDPCTVVMFDRFRGSRKDMVPEPTISFLYIWTSGLVPSTRYISTALST